MDISNFIFIFFAFEDSGHLGMIFGEIILLKICIPQMMFLS